MLRRLRLRRSLWSALALGILAVPAMLGGSAASPAESQDDPLPQPELNPIAVLPPDPADLQAGLQEAQALQIADLAPEEYRSLVIETAKRHELDPRLVASVITVETRFKADAVGGHGELGLMQILPSTGQWLAARMGLDQYDLSDPATSVDMGSYYLAMLIEEHGTPERALAAYNGGPRAVAGWETNGYVRKVMKVYDQLPPSKPSTAETSPYRETLPHAS